jgi:hypothetical protein
MAKKKVEKSVVAELMEGFIEEGTYPKLKRTEAKIDILTTSIKQRLQSSEVKRHEFSKYNLVGRFIAKKVYETEIIGLNEYLKDLGLLLHVVEIDNNKMKTNELYLDMITPFVLDKSYFIKPNFNKAGKLMNQLTDYEVTEEWKIQDMAKELSILKPLEKSLINDYEKLKWQLLNSEEMKKLMLQEQRSPIPHRFGSISLMENPPKYDISKIYQYFGEGLLIDFGVPNGRLLDQFILNGTITKKEIDQFKTVKDIRLDFSVMTLEDEEKLLNLLDNKKRITATNRMGA